MRNGYSFSKESIPASKTHCPMVFTSVFSLTSSFHLFSRILDTVASVPSLPLGYLLFSLIRSLLFFYGSFPGTLLRFAISYMYSIPLVSLWSPIHL